MSEPPNVSSSGLVELSHPRSRQRLTLAPAAGCCATAWTREGQPYLHLNQSLPDFLSGTHTGGLPLLYPWANRLRGDSWSFRGTSVDLADQPGVHRDGEGRPMHGLLLRWPQWDLELHDGGLTASLDWSAHEHLMTAFPFAHRLRLSWTLEEDGLEVRTTVVAAERGVPVSFGWHPYLVLPDARRSDLSLDLPELQRVELDSTGLPRPDAPRTSWRGVHAIGAHAWDHAFAGVRGRDRVDLFAGDRRLRLELLEGYRWLQVYSPEGADFVCIEPMTAATAALSDADAVPIVEPHGTFSARFRISIRDERNDRR